MLALSLEAPALAILHVELPAFILQVQLLLGQDLHQLVMPRETKADLHSRPMVVGLDGRPSQPMPTEMSTARQASLAFGLAEHIEVGSQPLPRP